MYSYKYKNTVVAILLACILTMAVGYAALQQRLNITGTSNISSVYDVRFTNIKSTPSNENVTDKVAPSYTNTTATFSTNLTSPGDTMTYDITVSNLGTLDAKLILVTMSDSNNPAIEFTYEGVKAGDVLKSQESTVVKVTVKYSDTVTTQPDSISSDLTIKLDYGQITDDSVENVGGGTGSYLAQAIPGSMWLNGPLERTAIQSVSFTTTNEVPTEVGEHYWDASAAGDGSVMAWYTDNDSSGTYEVTIGQNGGVKANPNSSYLFYGFSIDLGGDVGIVSFVEDINLANYNTTGVYDMSYMFYNLGYSIDTLDVSNFDTSKVTNMSHMFYNLANVEVLDVSNFITSNVTDMENMFSDCYVVRNLDVSNFDTSKVTNMAGMFRDLEYVTTLDVSEWDTSNVTNMFEMFYGSYDITTLDVSNFKTGKVTNMAGMFGDLMKVEVLDVSNFDTSNVTDMSRMFSYTNIVKTLDVSNFKTSKVTNMSRMFNVTDANVLDVSEWDTSNVTNMAEMFSSADNVKVLDVSNFKTGKVTDMNNMFRSTIVEELDLSKWDVSKVTNMSGMFRFADYLTDLNTTGWDTSNVENMSSMFISVPLKEINLSHFNTSKVTNMSYMFEYCSDLTLLDVSNFNTSNTTNMTSMFASISSITELDLSSFNTSKVTDMSRMFSDSDTLKTIYVSDLFVTTAVTDGSSMFYGTKNLVGQSGKTYSYDTRGYEYANYETGYFTYKANN